MAKSNITSTQFAAKKLLGKSHVRNTFTDAQEAYTSPAVSYTQPTLQTTHTD